MPRWHLVLFSIFLIIAISLASKPSETDSSFQSSSSSNSKSSYDSNSQNSTCFLPNCRKCDILDLESCTCTPVFVKCAKGFTFDEESCNCIESGPDSSLCPDLKCPEGQHINEARCECTDKICQTFVPCPSNTILDLETCECICNLDPNLCPDYYIFDEFNCLCRHPVCDPPGPCPGSSVWDTELCQCKCTQKDCEKDFIFDVAGCDCVLINSTESSATEHDTKSELTSSESHYNCDPPSLCPGLSSWNKHDCACVCAVKVKCFADHIFNNETCQCENPNGTSSSSVFESSTEISIESPNDPSSSCYIPDCKPCDFFDAEECYCYKIAIDCIPGYWLDDEGCSCVPMPGYNECFEIIPCLETQTWNSEACKCQCKENFECKQGYVFNADACLCIPVYESETYPSQSCLIERCGSCEYLDKNICQCIKFEVSCEYGFGLNSETCACEAIPGFSLSSSSESQSCPLNSCGSCEYLDKNICQCIKFEVSCEYGFGLNSETCACEAIPGFSLSSSSESQSCPIESCGSCEYLDTYSCQCLRYEVSCEYGYRPNEEGCYCEPIPGFSSPSEYDSSMQSSLSESYSCSIPDCRWCDHLDLDNCVCNRRMFECPYNYHISDDGCSCVSNESVSFPTSPSSSYSCEQYTSCPEKTTWNRETCECQCIENILCIQNYTFNPMTCECEPTFEGSTKPSFNSASLISSCSSNPDCRWCDYMDVSTCECYKIAIDCTIGYELSSDECSCIPISGFSYPSFEEPSSESSGPIPTFPCLPASPCPDKHFWNQKTCSCECLEQTECSSNYELSLRTCKCEPIIEATKSSESSSVSDSLCFIPDCRWCDFLDYENCDCHRIEFECFEGFQKSKDGCSCFSISNGNLTLPPSVQSSSPCFIESCRWCDIINIDNCTCQRAFIDCASGFELSSDGCSCIKSSENSSSSSAVASNNSSSSSSFSNSSSSCSLPFCRSCDVLDTENCVCHTIVIDCAEGFKLSDDGCSCEWVGLSSSSELVSSTSDACGSSPPPYCRWCDHYDAESCICHMRYVDCGWGYDLSPDGCTCIESTNTSSSDSSSSSSSSDVTSETSSINSPSPILCSLPSCRSCDILDTENCMCHKRIVDCFQGYELSEDGCECVKSTSTSENCPGIYCNKGTYIDGNTCQCMNDACKVKDPCPDNLSMDAQTCECYCHLNPTDCSFPYTFDYANCKCRHPPCDPPGPCPNKLSWDPENCKCRCIQNKACDANFIFDSDSCDCVCDPKMMNTTCPSGSVYDSLLCDCIEEIDCYDLNDPACACECEEVLDCPPGKEFDLDYCECLCPYYEVDPCEDGFMTSDDTCECIKNPYHEK
ncbi:hypothetical protein ACKWTF_011542 [Chironomus riparius]